MLVSYASAFVIMPGDLGALDELTEPLTLMQVGKIKPFPVVPVDRDYPRGLLTWPRDPSLEKGSNSEEDFELPRIPEGEEVVFEATRAWKEKRPIPGNGGLTKGPILPRTTLRLYGK